MLSRIFKRNKEAEMPQEELKVTTQEEQQIQEAQDELRAIQTMDFGMSDEEILAQAEAIRARIAQAEAAKRQQEVDAEAAARYKEIHKEQARLDKGRREEIWAGVSVGINAQTPSIMDVLDQVFGDTLSHEMKCAIGVLVRMIDRDDRVAQSNPINGRTLKALEDFMLEDKERRGAA